MLGDRGQVINYHHIIHSLIRKPTAFKNYRYSEELYPTENLRAGFDELIAVHGDRNGWREYLRILKLAAETIESEVESALLLLLANIEVNVSYKEEAGLMNIEKKLITDMGEFIPDLNYDDLI